MKLAVVVFGALALMAPALADVNEAKVSLSGLN